MMMTEKIKNMSLEDCLEAWRKFRSMRQETSKLNERWYLTVQDRESILERLLVYHQGDDQ